MSNKMCFLNSFGYCLDHRLVCYALQCYVMLCYSMLYYETKFILKVNRILQWLLDFKL